MYLFLTQDRFLSTERKIMSGIFSLRREDGKSFDGSTVHQCALYADGKKLSYGYFSRRQRFETYRGFIETVYPRLDDGKVVASFEIHFKRERSDDLLAWYDMTCSVRKALEAWSFESKSACVFVEHVSELRRGEKYPSPNHVHVLYLRDKDYVNALQSYLIGNEPWFNRLWDEWDEVEKWYFDDDLDFVGSGRFEPSLFSSFHSDLDQYVFAYDGKGYEFEHNSVYSGRVFD